MGKKKPAILEYCRYYKGEDACPFVTGSNQGVFWDIERQYVENAAQSDDWCGTWENYARRRISAHPKRKSILTSEDTAIQTKGIAMYILEMLAKWMPYDGDIFADY